MIMVPTDELQRFLFEGLDVRGALVRLGRSWQEVLLRQRRGQPTVPDAVYHLLGEILAAGVLMRSGLPFDGTLWVQIVGDGPLKLALAEVRSDLSLRATLKWTGGEEALPSGSGGLCRWANVKGQGRCAITLDPADRRAGQQPYQGIVALHDAHDAPIEHVSVALEQYMQQSAQIDTRLVLAANDEGAAGLLIQRVASSGGHSRPAEAASTQPDDTAEHFARIAHLAGTITPGELLGLETNTLLHRLFWQEPIRVFEPTYPRFACTCSRTKVAQTLRQLGHQDVLELLQTHAKAEVHCDFCQQGYSFDAVDVEHLFAAAAHDTSPFSTSTRVQ